MHTRGPRMCRIIMLPALSLWVDGHVWKGRLWSRSPSLTACEVASPALSRARRHAEPPLLGGTIGDDSPPGASVPQRAEQTRAERQTSTTGLALPKYHLTQSPSIVLV